MKYVDSVCKRYKVTFVKNGIKYKAGDVAEVGLVVGVQFCKEGLVIPTVELLADARKYGFELATKRKKKEVTE